MNMPLAEYATRHDFRHVMEVLTDLGFTNKEIAELAYVSSPHHVSYWRSGTRRPSPQIHSRLEVAMEVAMLVENASGEGYARKFFFFPLANNPVLKPYGLLHGENPDLTALYRLADGFKDRVISEEIPSTVDRTVHQPAPLTTGIEAADYLFAHGFNIAQVCLLMGENDPPNTRYPTSNSFVIHLNVVKNRVESRLKLAQGVYIGLAKVQGSDKGRKLMFWPSPLLRLPQSTIAATIGALPQFSGMWPSGLHDQLQAAIDWLNDSANGHYLPRYR